MSGVPGGLAELGLPVQTGDLPQVAQVEHAVDVVDLDFIHAEPLDQPGAQRGIHGRADLESHDLAEAPAPNFVLDRLKEVIGLVRDLEVGVAGDPEHLVAEDLQTREQRVKVPGDDLLERDERVRRDLHEAREDLLGDLDPREDLVVDVGVVQADDQAERQVREVSGTAARADGQRREHRKDLLAEVPRDQLVRCFGLLAADDPDAVLGELRLNLLGKLTGVPTVEIGHPLGDAGQDLRGGQAVGTASVDSCVDLIVHAGHADHEELVEVRAEDGQELDALEQRHARPRRAAARGR